MREYLECIRILNMWNNKNFICRISVVILCCGTLVSGTVVARDNFWGWFIDKGGPVWSSSIANAKRRGVFVTSLTADPGLFKVSGQEVKVKEAWIEKRFNVVFDKVGKRTVEDGYNIVFLVGGGIEVLEDYDVWFSLNGEDGTFTRGLLPNGLKLHVDRLESGDAAEVVVFLVFRDKDKKTMSIKFKRPPEQK